jgi:hypothetical protein
MISFAFTASLRASEPAIDAGLVSDDGDRGQPLAVFAEGAAHLKYPPTGIAVGEQVLGEPQRTEEAFVGDQASRL